MQSETSDAYDRRADAYENRWKRYLEHTHHAFLARLETSPDDIILDLSCGTGLLARQMIDRGYRFGRMVLNDISDRMLASARRRLGDNPAIGFTAHEASDLPFDGGSFTKILCLNAFHHYRDKQAAAAECRRVLRPGGQLFILDWNNSGFFRPVNFVISRTVSGHIDTCSMTEADDIFTACDFSTAGHHEWYWYYWKFFSFKAEAYR